MRRAVGWRNSARMRCPTRRCIHCAWRSKNSGRPFRGCSRGKGFRVLAVAAGPPAAMQLAGLIALSDPPRADSAALVTELHRLGVRTVMVTGDAPATAAIVAQAVGLGGAVCPPGAVSENARPEEF